MRQCSILSEMSNLLPSALQRRFYATFKVSKNTVKNRHAYVNLETSRDSKLDTRLNEIFLPNTTYLSFFCRTGETTNLNQLRQNTK